MEFNFKSAPPTTVEPLDGQLGRRGLRSTMFTSPFAQRHVTSGSRSTGFGEGFGDVAKRGLFKGNRFTIEVLAYLYARSVTADEVITYLNACVQSSHWLCL